MGWVTPTVASGNADYSLGATGTSGYNALRINTGDPNQYFLIENRQLVGFDAGLYRWFSASSGGAGGGGLAIWHIDESMTDNNTWTHKMVDLEEANTATLGYGELDYYASGNPPPRQGNRHHYYYAGHIAVFGDGTTPDTRLYDGRNTYANISAVSTAGPVMKCYVSLQPSVHQYDWITFLGGAGYDYVRRVAIDPQDNIVVTGVTWSYPGGFPTTPGAYDTYLSGQGLFISKFSPAGTLLRSTVLEAPGFSAPYVRDLALDSAGLPHICGEAYGGLPVTPGAYDTSYNGGSGEQAGDAFAAKFDSELSTLVYCTYLGGSGFDGGLGIAVDSAGNAHITGRTQSSDFPCTLGAYGNNGDIFVTKLNPSGSGLVYSRLFGTQNGYGYAIAVDPQDNAVVAGNVGTATLPVTTGAYDTTHNGQADAFVTKLGTSGSIDYSTYLGGSSGDTCVTVTTDDSGDVYMAGITASVDFPTTAGVVGPSYAGGGGDGFVTKLHPTAYSGLTYSTYLNIVTFDYVAGIAIDLLGQAYLAGFTRDASMNYDAKLWGLNDTATGWLRADSFAGSANDDALDAAIDSRGVVYLVGSTYSSNFPVTPNAYDPTYNGSLDGFIAKLGWAPDVTHVVVGVPDGGEQWELGQTLGIQWSSSGAGTTVDTELSRNGGGTWELLFDNTANDGAENWTVSGSVSTNCLIRITDSYNSPPPTDVSNAPFVITSISGDLDGDQDVDMNDAAIFSGVLLGTDTDPNHMVAADVNDDGNVDGLDIQPFLDEIL
jgi:hypothetical protein